MSDTEVAIVTGGSSGIGRALAQGLAARGAMVMVVARSADALADTVTELPGEGHSLFACDLGETGAGGRIVETCIERYGRLDTLIYSAGIATAQGLNTLLPQVKDLPLDDWIAVLNVNLHGLFECCKAAAAAMSDEGGRILVMGSSLTPAGMAGQPLAAAYSATKFAQSAFVAQFADEVAEDGITARIIYPGAVATRLTSGTALAPTGLMSVASFAESALAWLEMQESMGVSDVYLLPVPQKPMPR